MLSFSQDCEDEWKLAELQPSKNYQVKLKLVMKDTEEEDTEMSGNREQKKAQIMITEIGDIRESNRVFCDTYSKIMSNYLAQNDFELKPADFCQAIATQQQKTN